MILISASLFEDITYSNTALIIYQNEDLYTTRRCEFINIANTDTESKSGVLFCGRGNYSVNCCSFHECVSLNTKNNRASNAIFTENVELLRTVSNSYLSCHHLNSASCADSPVFVLNAKYIYERGENFSACQSGEIGSTSIEISASNYLTDSMYQNINCCVGYRAIYLDTKGFSHSNIINTSVTKLLDYVSSASYCCFFQNTFEKLSTIDTILSEIYTDSKIIASLTTSFTLILYPNSDSFCAINLKETPSKQIVMKNLVVAVCFLLSLN